MIGVVTIVKVTIAVEAKVSKQVNLHSAKIANESRGVGMGHYSLGSGKGGLGDLLQSVLL